METVLPGQVLSVVLTRPGPALLPGRKVLGPTLQPMDKEHASPPIYLPPPPPEGFSGYTVVTDRDCAGK